MTRPAHQAEPLCQALEDEGATVIRLPLIEIEALDSPALPNTQDYDWLIFTSPNAVHLGLAGLGQIDSKIAAVGAATARALKLAGQDDVVIPTRDYSSEGLLACEDFMQPAGQQVLLIKGEGGRDLITSTLRERGALVTERVVYQRHALNPKPDSIVTAIKQAHSVIATSLEILQSLVESCPAQVLPQLQALQLVVPSERVVKRARGLGFRAVHCVESPLTEKALVQALQNLQPASASSGQRHE
ncbi:MAG: uroporphyrinogen-III synthase [Salinisphaeraceae bacterium]|nr:uroporphyrinogen-III synthase [Salinisphaeraceae bacterium]